MKKRLLALLTVLVLVVGVSTNVLADPFTPIIPFSTSIDVYAVDM